MKPLYYILLAIVFLFVSCRNSKNTNSDKGGADSISTSQQAEFTDSTNFEHFTETDKVDRSIWKGLPIKNLPIIDTTNFDWYDLMERDTIDEKEIKRLNLKSLNEYTEIGSASFHYNYRIQFSDDFYSIVISINIDNMALATYLVNFDKNDKIIDKLEIAFDETAESIYRKTSDINQNKIVVEAISSYDEPIFIKTENYIIEKSGTFKETMTTVIDFEKLATEKHKK